MLRLLAVVFAVVLWVQISSASTYLVLEEGQQRCFIEELPKDTLVTGKYMSAVEPSNLPPSSEERALVIKLTVTDADGNAVLTRDMTPQGRFAFTTQTPGEHRMCFTTAGGRWFGTRQRTRLFLDIETGGSAVDYEELEKQEQLGELGVRIRKINDRIKDIRAEQNYQRNREIAFRDTSESTNSRVMWWSILQTAVLVACGLWQISHLRSFFKTKKLV